MSDDERDEKPPKRVSTEVRMEALANELLAKYEMTSPSIISPARIFHHLGVDVRFGPAEGADARTVRAGNRAWICVDERVRDMPRGRSSLAHELAHYLLHADRNAIERIHANGPKTGLEHQIEREANLFGTSFLTPGHMFGPYCDAARPTLREVDRVAQNFGVSLHAAMFRYAKYATAPCAALECHKGGVRFPKVSASFRGVVVGRREIDRRSHCGAVLRGDRMPGVAARAVPGTWGSERVAGGMTEHVFRVSESGVLLVWLSH